MYWKIGVWSLVLEITKRNGIKKEHLYKVSLHVIQCDTNILMKIFTDYRRTNKQNRKVLTSVEFTEGVNGVNRLATIGEKYY